jgi:excisionase family DNA binding protein
MKTDEIATRADLIEINEKLNRIERALSSIVGCRPDDDELLSRQQVADMLRVSVVTVAIMTKDGRLRGARIGRQIRYRRKDILKALEVIKSNQYKR